MPTIKCNDVDLNIPHTHLLTCEEARLIAIIDPAVPQSVELLSTRSRVDVRTGGEADIWHPAAGGQAHWTMKTADLIAAAQDALSECDEGDDG